MFVITSPQNPRVKDAVRLRDRRHREKQGRILIDGARELQPCALRRACGGGGVRLRAAVPERGRAAIAGRTCRQAAARCLHVSEAVFEKLAFGQRAEGVLGVAEMPRPTLESLVGWGGDSVELGWQFNCHPNKHSSTAAPTGLAVSTGAAPLVAVLEGVEKPGNVGAVLRSADAAGVSAVIVADPRTDLYNPNAIRASLGTIFTHAGLRGDQRRRAGLAAGAANTRFSPPGSMGPCPTPTVDYRGPTAIVLGSEAAGLSPVWAGDDIRAVRLPMLGVADSLNVSVTAAVLFYEALRQRSG